MDVPVGFAVEPDDASVMDDAVDDGGSHVAVAEHVAPSAELEVRGEDDVPPFVAVRDDPEQETGTVDVDGQVAEFVDDEQAGLADCLEFPVGPAFVLGPAQVHDQTGRGEEPDGDSLMAGECADGDGEVVLPHPASPWSTRSSAWSVNSRDASCSRPQSAGNAAMLQS